MEGYLVQARYTGWTQEMMRREARKCLKQWALRDMENLISRSMHDAKINIWYHDGDQPLLQPNAS